MLNMRIIGGGGLNDDYNEVLTWPALEELISN